MRLKDKVAVVTGAGSGIGRAIAVLFAMEGAEVVAADLTKEGGSETVELIKEKGGYAVYVKADVSSARDVRKMIKTAVNKYGKLDILVNNAGIEGKTASTADCSEEDWDQVLEVNLKGVFLGCKYAIPEMLRNGGGAIVNMSSIAGLVGFPNAPAYCASKAGIMALTRVTALEYATKNIRANCICPGIIKTPMIDRAAGGDVEVEKGYAKAEPVGRLGRPEEVAKAALYLASSDSSFVTGTALVIDGGWTAQ